MSTRSPPPAQPVPTPASVSRGSTTIEDMLAQLIPLAETSFSSGSAAVTQLVQAGVYLLARDRHCLSLEVSLVDARTEVARLSIENANMRGAHDQLFIAQAHIVKLREELQSSRGDVEKITKERDDAVVTAGERTRELGIQKGCELEAG